MRSKVCHRIHNSHVRRQLRISCRQMILPNNKSVLLLTIKLRDGYSQLTQIGFLSHNKRSKWIKIVPWLYSRLLPGLVWCRMQVYSLLNHKLTIKVLRGTGSVSSGIRRVTTLGCWMKSPFKQIKPTKVWSISVNQNKMKFFYKASKELLTCICGQNLSLWTRKAIIMRKKRETRRLQWYWQLKLMNLSLHLK